jgi:putative RNA 2'-phosphotransferase
MADSLKSKSKFLSLILRHKPGVIGITLDENGWTNIEDIISKAQLHGFAISINEIFTIVASDGKQRFALSPDLKRIRANQGHSLQVDLQLQPAIPPEVLYHGTAERNVASIKVKGILKGKRHHVHLSADQETARAVGSRYGKPVVVVVDTRRMLKDNFIFFKTANGVWLTDIVPASYLQFGEQQSR